MASEKKEHWVSFENVHFVLFTEGELLVKLEVNSN